MDSYTPEFTMPNTVPTQLLILATHLTKHSKFKPEILDLSHKFDIASRDEVTSQILEEYSNYRYFGISCFTSNYYLDTIYLANKIKKNNPEAIVLVGGYHPTIMPNDFLYQNSPFDFVFSGEAEIEFVKLITKIEGGYSKPQKTQIIYCEPVSVEDFVCTDWKFAETLNFIRKPSSNNLVMFPVFLSRGCPFRCAFCVDPDNQLTIAHRSWRKLSIDMAVKELININNRFQNRESLNYEIMICDPLFGTPEYRKELYNNLIKLAPNQAYWAELRIDTFKPDFEIPLLKKLQFHLSFGFESGAPEMLQIMNKTKEPKKFLDKMRAIAQKLEHNKIYCVLNILLGHPGETHETLSETFEYTKNLMGNKSFIIPSFSKFMLYPGSEIYNNIEKYKEKYGTEFLVKEWWRYSINQMRMSKLVNPSEEMNCIQVYFEMQKIVLNILKILTKNKIGKRPDMPLIRQKYLKHIMEDIMGWKTAPEVFIKFICNNIEILLGEGCSNAMKHFIKINIPLFLSSDCSQRFLHYIETKFPNFFENQE